MLKGHTCAGLLTGLVVDSGDGVTHTVKLASDLLFGHMSARIQAHESAAHIFTHDCILLNCLIVLLSTAAYTVNAHKYSLALQVAVIDGFSYPHLTKRLNVAGRHVTTHLVELLLRRGYAFNRSADFDTVRQMKEKLCYVACDYQKEVQVGTLPGATGSCFTCIDATNTSNSWHIWIHTLITITPLFCTQHMLGVCCENQQSRTCRIPNISRDAIAVLQLARETTHIVQSYTLPDGRVIKVGAERFMAAEIMFRPELIDIETPGISENVFNCIQVRFGLCHHIFACQTRTGCSRPHVLVRQ